ncbi:hypothetical protein H4217_005243 [Coemansia sp. RSA 1939]|nr:hypothetical protein H4217_005243 [Coemansia sp. RSA 1939]KAJ2609248.1 hypothetical protein EV177_004553 [Coemansia sp. RSA 1804]
MAFRKFIKAFVKRVFRRDRLCVRDTNTSANTNTNFNISTSTNCNANANANAGADTGADTSANTSANIAENAGNTRSTAIFNAAGNNYAKANKIVTSTDSSTESSTESITESSTNSSISSAGNNDGNSNGDNDNRDNNNKDADNDSSSACTSGDSTSTYVNFESLCYIFEPVEKMPATQSLSMAISSIAAPLSGTVDATKKHCCAKVAHQLLRLQGRVFLPKTTTSVCFSVAAAACFHLQACRWNQRCQPCAPHIQHTASLRVLL